MKGIKVKSFNTEKNEWIEVTYNHFIGDNGERIVDDTHFRPNVDNWSKTVGANDVVGSYDFEDGIDNGSRLRLALTNPKNDVVDTDRVKNEILNYADSLKEEAKANIDNAVKETMQKYSEVSTKSTEKNE